MTVFNIPTSEVCRNFDNNGIKTLKIGKFWVFLLNSVAIWDFFNLKTSINSLKKAAGQQTCSLLTLSNFPIHEVCQKFDKNFMKILKIWKVWVFCLFWCQFEIFSTWKPQLYLQKKTTGQQIRSLLTLFNIPIYEVCRKFDKNCIETLKIGKFWAFCHFRF